MRGSQNTFRGILAVGSSKAEAINRYRLTMMGKGASAFTDGSQGFTFLSNSAGQLGDLFNPITGEQDLVNDQALLDRMEFQSNSSATEANHCLCSAGCGAHLVFDDSELVKFCPVCASELDDEEAPDDGDFEDEDEPEEDEDDVDSSEDGEDEPEEDEDESSESSDDEEDEPEDDESGDDEEDEPEEDEGDSDDSEPLVVASTSLKRASKIYSMQKTRMSTSSDFDVNYLVCSGCDAHVLSDEDLHICPSCSSELEEPVNRSLSSGKTLAVSTDDEDGDEEDPDSFGDDDSSTDDEDAFDRDNQDEDDLGEKTVCGDDEEDEPEEDESGDDEEDEPEEDESGDDEEDEPEEDEGDSDNSGPLVVASTSLKRASKLYAQQKGLVATAGDVDVNYLVCSGCDAHVLSDEDLHICPSCSSELEEPVNRSLSSGKTLAVSTDDEDEPEDDEDLDLDDGECDTAECGDEDEDEPEDDESGDDDEDDGADLEPAGDEDDEGKDVSVNSMAVLSSDSTAKALDVVYCSSIAGEAKWVAFYEGQPVASLSRADAGKNRDIFDTAAFGTGIVQAAEHSGITTVFAELGFKPYTQTVSVSSIVDDLAADRIDEAKAEMDEKHEQYAERLQAALATAAIGLNRGFFSRLQNPLKDAVHSALSAAGVKSPEPMIDRIFRDNSDPYHKVLFVKANEIMQDPLEVQEALAKAVLDMNYSASADNNSPRVDDLLGNLGNVVTAGVDVAATAEPEQSTSTAEILDFSKVVSTLGSRRF